MTTERIAQWRMETLGLAHPRGGTPEEVVGWLGAVQSQDYGPAKWAVGQRIHGPATDAAIERAFNAGSILRTHVLRPTWHFVLPADIRWLLELTGPRVLLQNTYMCRREGLDDATQAAASALFAGALQDGNQLTRKQLEAVLTTGGIAATGFRTGYLLMNSELRGLICSGALAGKQHTYALLDERAPLSQARRLNRDEALAELTLRYFTSHGPATVKDFRWWSTLTVTEIRAGLALVAGQLEHEDVDGVTYWFGVPRPPDESRGRRHPSPTVHLVQGYDEYIVGYGETKFALDAAGTARASAGNELIFNMIVLLDSQVAGHWKRTVKRDAVHIEVALYAPFDAAQTDALHAACARHAEFLELALSVEVWVFAPGGTGGRSWWTSRGSGAVTGSGSVVTPDPR